MWHSFECVMQVCCEGHWRETKKDATLQFFCFRRQESSDLSSSACAASAPSAKMAAGTRHLQESLFPINKCVHVLSHRRRRGWRPRGRRGQRRGILEWGSWSGSRKRYTTPALARPSYDVFFISQPSWMKWIHLTAPKVQPSSRTERKLNMETVLYLPPEQLNLYSAVLQKSFLTRCPGRFIYLFIFFPD